MPGDPEPTHAPLVERPEQPAAIICDERQGPASERTSMLAAGAILIADGVFDLLVGATLIASTITSASGLLGAGSLKPWPLFVVIGAGCLAVSGLLLAASTSRSETAGSYRICVDHPPEWVEPTYGRSQPCPFLLIQMPSISGMDVHKDSISVGIFNPGHERPDVEKIFHDEESVRRLIVGFPTHSAAVLLRGRPHWLRPGPSAQVARGPCEVIAPSMIPKAPVTRSRQTPGTLGAWPGCTGRVSSSPCGSLPARRGGAGPVRARGDMVEDLTRARNRLTKFLLRHSRVWRDGSNWTVKHEAWLERCAFDEPALQDDL